MNAASQTRTIDSPSPAPTIEVVNVSRWYGNVVAVMSKSSHSGAARERA